MILSKVVKNKWNSKNKNRYVSLGYIFTKCGDMFNVKVEDLSSKSNLKIDVKCDLCNTEQNISYCDYMRNYLNGGYYTCRGCCRKKVEKTNLERYGYKNPSQNENIKNKKIETCLKHFGVQFPTQCVVVKNKIKETNLERFGVDNPTKNPNIRNKVKETILERYGCENSLQNESIKNKVKETNLERYGCENTFQNEDIKNKIKETNKKKYGVEYAINNSEVKKKAINTLFNNYGVENPTQNKEIIEKSIQTTIDRYGEVFFKLVPRYNPNSIIYLDMISDILNIPIQHGVNGGEKKFQRYWVDGYVEQYNICIEWDEKYHNTVKQKEKDLKREIFLMEKHNCKIIRINEVEFLNDIEFGIKKIINEINSFIK